MAQLHYSYYHQHANSDLQHHLRSRGLASPNLPERDDKQLIPSYISAFASSEISSACSCLSISPCTTTVKTISTVVAPAPMIVVKITIATSTVTATVSTVTVTASTTVTECASALPTLSYIFRANSSPVPVQPEPQDLSKEQISLGSWFTALILSRKR